MCPCQSSECILTLSLYIDAIYIYIYIRIAYLSASVLGRCQRPNHSSHRGQLIDSIMTISHREWHSERHILKHPSHHIPYIFIYYIYGIFTCYMRSDTRSEQYVSLLIARGTLSVSSTGNNIIDHLPTGNAPR